MVYFSTLFVSLISASLGRVGCLSNCVGLGNELADAMVERTERRGEDGRAEKRVGG